MKIISKIIFLFIITSNIFIIKAFGGQMERYDQTIPRGCELYWNGYNDPFSALFKANGSKPNNVQLNCNGTKYDYWYTDFSDDAWSAFGGLTCGKESGMCRSGVEPGVWWVADSRINADGKSSVKVCNSFWAMLWIQESCRWMQEDTTTNNFNINPTGSITIRKVQINEVDSGISANMSPNYNGEDRKHGSQYEVNGSGYMFAMFNNTDPYDATNYTTLPGYTMANNCKILRDYHTPQGCPAPSSCDCSMPSSPVKPSCDSCEMQANISGATMPEGCGEADDNGTYKNCDDSGLIQCDKYRIPLAMDPTCKTADTSKCYHDPNVVSLKPIDKQCYACNATPQTIYNNCSTGVQNAYPNTSKLPPLLAQTMYGPGTYVCAFYLHSGEYYSRIGCSKTALGVPPRYFPRIARTGNIQVNNIFQPLARVRQFRDVNYESKNPQFGRCGYGPAELGESSRGNFFTPYLQVIFGETDKQIKFLVNTSTTDMTLTYGPTNPGAYNDGIVSAPWNTSSPYKISYGSQNSNCTSLAQDETNVAFICTRIEYDGSNDAGSFAAYQVMAAGNASGTCASYEQSGKLTNIGSVPRPPLRYSYSPTGSPIMPLTIGSTNVALNPNASNSITLNPANSKTDIPQSLIGLTPMSENLLPLYYDVQHYDSNNPSNFIKPSRPCTMLFGHQYCVTRDACSLLWDFDTYDRDNTVIRSSCSSNDYLCTTYQALVKGCSANTYCRSKYSSVATCMMYKPQKFINTTINGTPNALQALPYYQQNIQWQDETCISSGFSIPNHSSSAVNPETQYGNSGSAAYDQVITYLNSGRSGSPLRPIRSSGRDDDNANASIIALPTNTQTSLDAAVVLANAVDPSSNNIAQIYFGTTDVNTIASLVLIRNRTMREIGLCGGNARDNFTDWSAVFNPGPGWYDIYLPLRCQYFEYGITGGQGGGTKLNNIVSDEYYTCDFTSNCHSWGCKHSIGTFAGKANGACVAGMLCGTDTPWQECTNIGSYSPNKYNAGIGSSGGTDKGILNNNDKQQSFISFFIGSGAKNKTDTSLYCFQQCADTYCPYMGYGYHGSQNSYIVPTALIPASYLTETTGLNNADHNNIAYAYANAGQSNIDVCTMNSSLSGGSAADYISSPSGNVYGDGSFNAGANNGNGMYCGNEALVTKTYECTVITDFATSNVVCVNDSYLTVGKAAVTCYPSRLIDSTTYTQSFLNCSGGEIDNYAIFSCSNRGSNQQGIKTGGASCTGTYSAMAGSNGQPIDRGQNPSLEGANGSAFLTAAKIKVDSISNPVLSGYSKQLAPSIRDPQCTPMCPRINIQVNMTSKGVTTPYICEYGGAGYDINEIFRSFAQYDFQTPAGFTAMPTRCFSANDGGKYLIYPSKDYYNADCSTNYTIIDNSRFYGFCANTSNISANYLAEFYSNTQNYFSMAGSYCPGGSCTSVQSLDTPNKYISYNSALLDEETYGINCLTGGMWANGIGNGNQNAIRRIADPVLNINCPAVSGNFNLPTEWSANAAWPITKPGATANGTCQDGFIPYSSSVGVSRPCGVSGVWGAVNNINRNICLYTCETKTDSANYIQWASPGNFSNPISIPSCLQGPGTVYVTNNGQTQAKTVSMTYVANTGYSLSDFTRTCNMPGASNPLAYIDVNVYTQDATRMPSWSAAPTNAKCVPPSFAGSCNIANAPHVCYDAGQNGNLTFATCDSGFIYNINGIPTYPPQQMISGSTLVPATVDKINMIDDNEYGSCTFNSTMPPTSGNDATCSSLDLMLQITYYDVNTGNNYKSSNISLISTTNAKVSTLLTNSSPAIVSNLMSNIINDVPSSVSSCTVNSSSSNANLLGYMTANNYCGQICYVPNSQNNMQFFDCSAINNIPSNITQCVPICGNKTETWYYYGNNGVGLNSNAPTVPSSRSTYGQIPSGALSGANSTSCIQKGILNGMPALHNAGQSAGVSGNYCSSVTYSTVIDVPDGTLINTPITNTAFNGKFSQTQLACWAPKNCTLPNGLGTLNHQNSIWDFVFDANNGFTYNATQNAVCPGGYIYNITANNMAFFKLYCYDGTLFKVEQLSGNSVMNYLQTTPCLAAVPQLSDIIPQIPDGFTTQIQSLPSINSAEMIAHSIIADITNGSFAIYDALKKLDNA